MLRRNVLIFHQAALGDFIVTWPLAMALSRILPQSRIIYVTHSQKGKLAERVLRVESADAEAGWHSLFSESPDLPEQPAKLMAGAHSIVTFGSIPGITTVAPDAKIVTLDTKLSGDGHATDLLVDQLDGWPALASAIRQMLRSIGSRGVGFSLHPQDRIVIHPGAGKEANRWPDESFLELIQRLVADGKHVRVLLGEAEIERWHAQLISRYEAIAEVHRPATLLELLDEIAQAAAFVGNDSGPSHLAGILGVPTVTLFGPSDPTRWRPLGPRVNVLHSQPIEAISVESVYTELTR